MIIFSSDYDKQEQVLALAKQNTGITYACIGIHPDNIKRTNEKQIQQRLELVHTLGMEKETYDILKHIFTMLTYLLVSLFCVVWITRARSRRTSLSRNSSRVC
jgi:hypothetical protein